MILPGSARIGGRNAESVHRGAPRWTLDGRTHAGTYAEIEGDCPGVLMPARAGEPFSAEEVSLLRGSARVLELSLQALHVIESERRHAREIDRVSPAPGSSPGSRSAPWKSVNAMIRTVIRHGTSKRRAVHVTQSPRDIRPE